jgi:D-alanyl-D-alanine carboxypeptidase
MKKVLTIVVVLLIFIPLKIKAISASSWIVMDSDSKRVLGGSDIDEERLIASTTKIMTCIIALENGKLTDKITVNESVLKAYGSAIYIEIGEELTLEDLLYGLMLRSGNDAAIVIKDYFDNKGLDIVEMMNQKAKELNMNNTIFYNPHGLEEDDGSANTSTSYDMALLMSYAINNKKFKKIVSTKSYTTKTNYKSYTWKNKNKLLFNYEFCNGGKTGYTKLAKRTLVTSASKDNKNLVVVTLNDGNDFDDHKTLYEEYFKKYETLKVIDKNKFKIYNESYYKGVNFYVKNDFQMLVTSSEKNQVSLNIILEKNENFEDNQKIGKAQVLLNNETIYEEDIYIVKKSSIKKKNFWNKIKNWFKNLFK